jgi:hypothetical protein
MASNGVNLPPNFFQEDPNAASSAAGGIFGRAVGQ